MSEALIPDELLAPFDPVGLPRRRYDVVVVGAGVAGLAFTLRLPAGLRVALLTKGVLGESNTRYAQGGLAAAVGLDDSPALHEADTLVAGAGLCDPDTVRRLVEGGPAAVDWLLALGTRFDRASRPDVPKDTRGLLLGREAAHSRRRVLHVGGDATGAEIERALVAGVLARPGTEVVAGAFAFDLILEDGRCRGIVAEPAEGAEPVALEAPVVVLAAGGAGQLWAVTSNPAGATADGLAMALRAGAAVADLEFAQFHPTVLALPGETPFLVSEAVRGEGAYLRGKDGRRFMLDLHPLAELAPRDVVARGIQRQMALDGRGHVDLDLRHLDAAAMRARFPTIARELAARGLDLASDLIPVAPAAHYFMGGIVAGPTGETSLPGLLALGEASCTGVHGANRLASNSLLEGLVFGLAAADRLAEGDPDRSLPVGYAAELDGRIASVRATERPISGVRALRAKLQQTMSRHVSVVRDGEGLAEAAAELDAIAAEVATIPPVGRPVRELRNMVVAARAIAEAARRREESRGAHFRTDYPEPDPALEGRHLVYDGDAGWRFGSLAEARRAAAIAGR
jgi:L-aspartate oxidase